MYEGDGGEQYIVGLVENKDGYIDTYSKSRLKFQEGQDCVLEPGEK